MQTCDVVVMGGGIAGAFLARQLKLARPELDVRVLESSPVMNDLKVGESTVEVAAHYMIRHLQLGPYLYQHQLPKNGLRFFFDSEGKDLPLTEMSEIGSDRLPFHPSFQLERAALERDLVALNRSIGVTVELGAKVVDLTVDGGGGHSVTYERAGERRELRCRWLCDASGRRHLLARKLGLKVHKETRLNTAAAWGRYRNVAGLDAVSDPAWRRRVRYTSRHLSTNHFMYDGYWLWFIPLAGDLMSVGAVYDKDRLPNGPRNRADFEAFMRSHRSSRDLMEGACFDDFQSYAHLPFHSDQYFSRDRWAMTGEAGAFTDPFYSPGSDFIATANQLITSMIAADLDGDGAAFEERVEAYNAFYRLKYETTIRLYVGLYATFGSFDVFRLKYLLDFHNYYNLVVWPFMADKITDVAWIRDELRLGDRILEAQSTMAHHLGRLAAHARGNGDYFRANAGEWSNGLAGVSHIERHLGPTLDETLRRGEVQRAYGSVFAAVLERLTGVHGLSEREAVLNELTFPAVVLFKEQQEGVRKLFERISARVTKQVCREFPDAGALRVLIDPRAEPQVRVVGPADDVRPAVEARAAALWDAKGESLAHARA